MKKELMIVCIFIFIFLYIININLLLVKKTPILTGSGITASVSLNLISPGENIYIDSPLNQTYNFSIGDNYTLDLNVSSDFNASNWFYDLLDMKHGIKVNNSIVFTPNVTFNAVRWSNKLIVSALNASGDQINKSVEFYINLPNSAPYFGPINSSIYVCENTGLDYQFNVSDVDEQVLQLALTPTNPFYLNTIFTQDNLVTSNIALFSGLISDENATSGINGWKVYEERIEVTDGEYSDTAYTNVTAIRVNDPLIMNTIGVQTVYTRGDNSTFYKQVEVTDEEDGTQNSSNIHFNISFFNSSKLFNITDIGIMNFTPNGNQTGVYNITVCANDSGIPNPFENISMCSLGSEPLTMCKNFSLTVTNENRAPTIINYIPNVLIQSVNGRDSIIFNITEYDPDYTIPDAYWYINDELVEYDAGSLNDAFYYSPLCGVSGTDTIKVEITDGLLNDSLEWVVTVNLVECSVSGVGAGGGGGGATFCEEKWVCDSWGICQSITKSLEVGVLSGEDYRLMNEECMLDGLNENFCGIQVRKCFDINFCNSSYSKPSEFQSCHYTENPSCKDGIKNCHDGSCELLVDCGGPCLACPSCTDKIKNQGEGGVDCGGPCPWRCKVAEPLLNRLKSYYIYASIIFLVTLSMIVIIMLRRIFGYKKTLREDN